METNLQWQKRDQQLPGDLWKEDWITKGHEDILKGNENVILIVVMSKFLKLNILNMRIYCMSIILQ